MRTLEPELRPVVVERLDATPRRLVMTFVTAFSKAPLMGIIRLVTVETTARRVAELYRLRVTRVASHCLVRVPEREIRECVIEGLAVELDDVGVSSNVIRVAIVAFLFLRIWLPAVKSLIRRTIRGNFLVARKAQPSLRPSRERLMTVAALLLELAMPGDDRPRRDELPA